MKSFVERKTVTQSYEKAPADDINDSLMGSARGISSDQQKLNDLLK